MSTQKTTTKIVAGVVSFAMALSFVFGGAVAPAQAQSVEALTAQIANLLSTIAGLQAQLSALQGGSSTPVGGTGYVFSRSLTVGDTGEDVKQLQMLLNRDPATQVAVSGAGSPGSESMYFGPATKAAVVKFQNKYAASVLAPVGLSAGTGYFGASTRAKANELSGSVVTNPTNPNVPTVPTNGTTVNVSLASDSPTGVAFVAGQAIADLAHFTFANTTGTPAKVTKLTFNRTGISSDSTLSNIYLFNGAVRLTDAASISNGVIAFNDASTGLFTVPAGAVMTVSVRADIATVTAGQIIGVSLTSVESNVTAAGSFPLAGYNNSIATASIGEVALTYTGPSSATENPGTDIRVFEASTVVSTNDAYLQSLALENRGTGSDGDLVNLKLYVDGVQVGSTVAGFSSDKMTFDLTSNPVLLKTGTRIIKVIADIVKGSSKTYDVQIRRAADIRVVDAQLNQPILATDVTPSYTGFPVSAATANSIASGTLSVSRSTDSPSDNVTVGATNVLLASFDFRASGEDIKIEEVTLDVDDSVATNDSMDNVKIFVNGSQVGSTKDVGSTSSDTNTAFTFGSSFVAKAGEITKVTVYGDAKTAGGTNFAAATVVDLGISVTASNTEGLSSGNPLTSDISEVEGFERTIASSSLTATAYSGYSNQTMIAGTNNARLGSFTLSAGSTEGINVNTVVINLSSVEAASVTDLMLKDASSGAQLGSTKPTPSTDNTFSVNFSIAASQTKTVDVYGNIKSGSGIGAFVATVDATTGGTGASTANSTTIGTDLDLQTITIGSGTLTTAVGISPDDSNVIAGSNDVKVGSFKFTAQNSPFTVQELKVKVPADAATSVASVILKWSGGSASQALARSSGAETYATATFTGLSFAIPQNTEGVLDVYVNIPTIASGASTGKAISVVLDGNEGFKAIDSAGSSTTALTSSADLDSTATTGKGTVYVRRSVPTFTSVALDSSTLSAGANTPIAKVKVAADSAGDIGWRKIVFAVTKTSALTTGATTTMKLYQGSNAIAGSFATTTGDLLGGQDSLLNLTSGNLIFVADSEQQIPAGSSVTYELKTTIGGIASGYNYLNVSIANPSTSVVSDAFADIHTAVGNADESIVWTDRSSSEVSGGTIHSATTDDWSNDYLIKNLPLNLSTLSVSNS